jgi:hypothetical protein
MMHRISADDDRYRSAFEALQIGPDEFDHAAHVRLAYVYLCEGSIDDAVGRMKGALLAFLAHLGIGPAKYHETITRAWVMAVDHFMNQSPPCSSSAELPRLHPQLLDSKIMLTHYSAEVLFSPAARQAFVEPDIQPIPPP